MLPGHVVSRETAVLPGRPGGVQEFMWYVMLVLKVSGKTSAGDR